MVAIRELVERDLPDVLALNQSEVPHVGTLDADRLASLWSRAAEALVAQGPGSELAAFVLAFGSGVDYGSENYRWFDERYDAFLYVDRIAVAPDWRRRGIASRIYDELGARTDAPWLTCEVNVEPPNPDSMAFHRRLGFVEVGRQDTEGGDKRVALLARRLG